MKLGNRLHHEGLLEVLPRHGYLIPEMSFHAVRDLFEARILMEGIIAELAALRSSAAEVKTLASLAAAPALTRPDTSGFANASSKPIRSSTFSSPG